MELFLLGNRFKSGITQIWVQNALCICIFYTLVMLSYSNVLIFRVHTHVVVRKPGELALRLALSAFIIFICYLALGVCSLLSALTPPPDAWVYRTMWFVVNDVLCNSSALVLLALNRPIRKVNLFN